MVDWFEWWRWLFSSVTKASMTLALSMLFWNNWWNIWDFCLTGWQNCSGMSWVSIWVPKCHVDIVQTNGVIDRSRIHNRRVQPSVQYQGMSRGYPKGPIGSKRVQDIAKMVQMAPITLQQLQNYRAQNRMARPCYNSGELLRNCRPHFQHPRLTRGLSQLAN